MSNNKQSHKITDEQFLEMYRDNKGNCSITAKAIEKKFGITYTRQAVYLRAQNFPEEKFHSLRLFDDHCEEGLINFADAEENSVNLRTRIYIHLRNSISKQLNAKNKLNKSQEPEGIFEIDGKEFSFADDADNSHIF